MFDFLKRRHNSEEDLEPPPKPPKGPPFPVQQMIVLSLCRITEPVAFCSIFAYAYFMVLSFGITEDPRKISIYCGMITSIFTFCEFATGIFWGRMSDVVGRKPVLVMGLFGTGLSMILFGFARNLPLALVARGIGGALNGNVGVIQTAVAEVVTVKEQQRGFEFVRDEQGTADGCIALAFSIMPFVWCVGAIVGSVLGGALADPVNNYPSLFSRGTIWEKYPFLLANIIAAAVTVLGMLNGIFFLNETNEKVRHKRDYGREAGHWITRHVRGIFGFGFQSHRHRSLSFAATAERNAATERDSLLQNGPGVSNGAIGPGKHFDGHNDSAIDDEEDATGEVVNVELGKTFNTQVVVQIVAYGLLAYHTIIFEQLLPVFLSMEENTEGPKNILKFTGGFGLDAKTIGIVLAAQGIYQMVFQIFFFAPIIYKLGCLRTYVFCAVTYPLLYVLTPYTVLLPKGPLRWIGLGVILFFKVTWSTLAYPANALLLTNAAPTLLVLGTINGVAASVASFARFVGPTFGGVIQSVGIDYGYGGLSWWGAAIVAVIGAIQCYWMNEEESELSVPGPTDTEEDLWERESIIFRRGSVAVNVSNVGEPSIVESQLLAGLSHRGSSAIHNMRRMSITSHRRPSISSTIRSSQTTATTRQVIPTRRERSISIMSSQSRQPPGTAGGTPSRGRRE